MDGPCPSVTRKSNKRQREEKLTAWAAVKTSKGLTSWCRRPLLGSAFGVVWSLGPGCQNLRLDALDLRYL